MSLLDKMGLQVYQTKWTVVGEPESFDEETKSLIKEAKVVQGDFGASVRLQLGDDKFTFISMDDNDPAPVGAYLDVDKMTIVTLTKGGETIYRARSNR